MIVSKEEVYKRALIISQNLSGEVILIENPITEKIEVFTAITKFTPPNININNYLFLEGRNITDYVEDKWFSLYKNNNFNTDYALQVIDDIPISEYTYSDQHKKWVKIRVF